MGGADAPGRGAGAIDVLEDTNVRNQVLHAVWHRLRLTKGREVAVGGKLRLNDWTGRDGERRSRIEVAAEAVQFLSAPTKKAEPADNDHGRQAGHRPYRRNAG